MEIYMGEDYHGDNGLSKVRWYVMVYTMLGAFYILNGVGAVLEFGAKTKKKLRRLSLSKQQRAELEQLEKLSGLR